MRRKYQPTSASYKNSSMLKESKKISNFDNKDLHIAAYLFNLKNVSQWKNGEKRKISKKVNVDTRNLLI